VVLGWGGYWGWDPVENASLLPWLVGVALVHTFTIYRNKGAYKRLAIVSALLAFVLVVLGTFITRSGVVTSVHAFEGDIVSFVLFAGLMIVTLSAGLAGLFVRWKSFAGNDELHSFVSRDAAYYFNSILMILAALLIAYLTLSSAFPAWMPFGGETFGVVGFNNIVRPVAIVYCLLLAVCPMLAWRRTDGKRFWQRIRAPLIVAAVLFAGLVVVFITELFPRYAETIVAGGTPATDLIASGPAWYYHTLAVLGLAVASIIIGVNALQLVRMVRFYRKSSAPLRARFPRLGAYIAHLGIGVCLVGLIGSSMYTTSADVLIPDEPGASVQFENYRFEFVIGEIDQGEVTSHVIVHLKVYGESGWYLGSLDPSIEVSMVSSMRRTIPATLFSPLRDVFVVFYGFDNYDNISLMIKVNPLISCVWLGFGLLMAGTLIAAFARRGLTGSDAGKQRKAIGAASGKAASGKKEADEAAAGKVGAEAATDEAVLEKDVPDAAASDKAVPEASASGKAVPKASKK